MVRTYASHGFLTLCRFFLRLAGRKKNLHKKERTLLAYILSLSKGRLQSLLRLS